MTFTIFVGDTADTIRDYLRRIDPSTLVDRSGSGRNNTYYFLAPRVRIYVEVIRKTAGLNANDPGNMVTKINIFSKFRAHTINIASRLNNLFPDGMLAHLDWNKIEKKFHVSRSEVLAAWHSLLSQVVNEERPSPEELARREAERKEFDHELKILERDELEQTKKFKKVIDKYRD
ncbi:MAG: hypothetical protein ACTSRS_12370 [Candidatus Helarchaeota archaeon]